MHNAEYPLLNPLLRILPFLAHCNGSFHSVVEKISRKNALWKRRIDLRHFNGRHCWLHRLLFLLYTPIP